LKDKYNFDSNPVYTQASYTAWVESGGNDSSLLKEQQFNEYKPESSNSFEIGYKGLINNQDSNWTLMRIRHVMKISWGVSLYSIKRWHTARSCCPKTIFCFSEQYRQGYSSGVGISLQYLLQHRFFY
jgi:hypothetical protein